MALFDARLLASFQPRGDRCRDGSGMRAAPERIVLGVRDGVTPSPKPPVRIFLGTEPAQYRAERIFVWSIEQVRDPSRVYEIHLMKELAGFDRRMWLTGFTNYRYAIPHFAGGTSRAIWNDVDQIYLSDPAELFDMDLGGFGFVTVPAKPGARRIDSSVMLMDCARLAEVWTLEAAQRERSYTLLDRATSVPGLHGEMAGEWNARDEEYVPGESKLIHYTTLHKQPWCPIPKRYVYQRNPVGEVWYELERSADAEGFQVFGREHPSARARALAERLAAGQPGRLLDTRVSRAGDLSDLRRLAAATGARTMLELGLDSGGIGLADPLPALPSERAALAETLLSSSTASHDAVVCAGGLEYFPDEDLPWMIEELFARARCFVHVRVDEAARPLALVGGQPLQPRPRGFQWWVSLFEKAAARRPQLRFKLVVSGRGRGGREFQRQREGGGRRDAPVVWVLTDDSPGHTRQSTNLAEALGWGYETRRLRFGPLSSLGSFLPGLGRQPLGLDRRRSDALSAPWPEIVIGCGRRASGAARWVGDQSEGATRVIELDRRAAQRAEPFDIVVSSATEDCPPSPRRIETTAPLTGARAEELTALAEEGSGGWPSDGTPRVALLAGRGVESAAALRMRRDAEAFAREAAGAFAVICRGEALTGEELARLAAADVIVVAGDSPALLAEASSTGKPVYIYDLPARGRGRVASWIEARARAAPTNGRGTVRPQRGLEYLCARLVERGFVARSPDPVALREALIERRIAEPFGAPLRTSPRPALHEADDVARRIRPLLGFAAAS